MVHHLPPFPTRRVRERLRRWEAMWEEVVGDSRWVARNFLWIWVDFFCAAFHFYINSRKDFFRGLDFLWKTTLFGWWTCEITNSWAQRSTTQLLQHKFSRQQWIWLLIRIRRDKPLVITEEIEGRDKRVQRTRGNRAKDRIRKKDRDSTEFLETKAT